MIGTLMKPSTGFAGRLRTLRETAGVTQADLAQRAQISLTSLVKLESAKQEPTWLTVIKLAEALGCQPNDFLSDGEPSDPPKRPRGRPKRQDAGTRDSGDADADPDADGTVEK